MENNTFVNDYIQRLSRFQEGFIETGSALDGVREFALREEFPSESTIEEEVLGINNRHNDLFIYDMLLNLWNAFKNPTIDEVFIAIREVGQMSASREEMRFNVSLFHFILNETEEELFDSECGRNNLPYPAVFYCKGIITKLWEGIHGWEN